jgi:hypothetical protein
MRKIRHKNSLSDHENAKIGDALANFDHEILAKVGKERRSPAPQDFFGNA